MKKKVFKYFVEFPDGNLPYSIFDQSDTSYLRSKVDFNFFYVFLSKKSYNYLIPTKNRLGIHHSDWIPNLRKKSKKENKKIEKS